MKTSRLHAALLAALVALGAGFPIAPGLRAQAVTGVGDDATLPRKGELRFGMFSIWNRWYERYASNGTVQPLGANFNFDTIGVAQFENLAPLQGSVRSLAGMPDFNASLGASHVRVRDNVYSTPLSLELGLTSRVTLSVMAPFVTATSNVNFLMNPTGHEATVGFNPTLIAPAAFTADTNLLRQFANAAVLLNQAIAGCAATPGSPGCAQINANPAAARALIGNADAFAGGLAGVYGGRGAAGSLFVPLEGTVAQAAIEAKVAAFRAMYGTYGIGAITGTGPLGSQAPFTAADLQSVLTDSAFGVKARPLATSVNRGLGDVEFGLKVNVFDSFHGNDSALFAPKGFNWRQSFGGVYRLGTGTLPSPADFTALGTGDHQSDIAVRTYTDLLFGRHLWVSLVGSFTTQAADQVVMRIPDSPTQAILAAYRQESVQRHLGDVVEIQVNPRWTINDYISLGGQYYYRHKAADVYSGTFSVTDLAGNPLTLNAAMLGMYTEASEHRLGVGATYSTVANVRRHNSGLAFDISYFHSETTLGSMGYVPKIAVDQVSMRIYQRLWGR